MHVEPIFKSLQWQEMLVKALDLIMSKVPPMSAYCLSKCCSPKEKDGWWATSGRDSVLPESQKKKKKVFLKGRPKGQEESGPANINRVG